MGTQQSIDVGNLKDKYDKTIDVQKQKQAKIEQNNKLKLERIKKGILKKIK